MRYLVLSIMVLTCSVVNAGQCAKPEPTTPGKEQPKNQDPSQTNQANQL